LKSSLEDALLKEFKNHLSSHDLVVFSDYAKGLFSPKGLRTLIEEARNHGKLVLVDPKGNDYSRYKGATLLTPNRHEFASTLSTALETEADLVGAAQKIMETNEISAMIITRGEQGMTLVKASGLIEHLPTRALEVFDVSGAGDTVIATLATSLAAGASFSDAMHVANTAAGLVVAKIGTAVVHQEELLTALHHQEVQALEEKILSWKKAEELAEK
jgi:D-beta-D-heptose 7-phosphate kinase/D-beta-D-heptose 1-phosphate adenosyltransferase